MQVKKAAEINFLVSISTQKNIIVIVELLFTITRRWSNAIYSPHFYLFVCTFVWRFELLNWWNKKKLELYVRQRLELMHSAYITHMGATTTNKVEPTKFKFTASQYSCINRKSSIPFAAICEFVCIRCYALYVFEM